MMGRLINRVFLQTSTSQSIHSVLRRVLRQLNGLDFTHTSQHRCRMNKFKRVQLSPIRLPCPDRNCNPILSVVVENPFGSRVPRLRTNIVDIFPRLVSIHIKLHPIRRGSRIAKLKVKRNIPASGQIQEKRRGVESDTWGI